MAAWRAEVGDDATRSSPLPQPPFPTQRAATLYALRRLGIANIASDDLAVEFGAHEPAQPCMRDGRLLIADDVTSPLAAVVRMHRRRGDMRLLAAEDVVLEAVSSVDMSTWTPVAPVSEVPGVDGRATAIWQTGGAGERRVFVKLRAARR